MFGRPWGTAAMELPYAQEVKRKKPNPSTGQEIMRFAAARSGRFASLEGRNLEKEIMQRGGRARSVNCRACPMLFPFPFFFPVVAGKNGSPAPSAGYENRVRGLSRKT
mgnify:CR=1 FL=1